MKKSDDRDGNNLWGNIKEKIKKTIFDIANNESFVSRTNVLIERFAASHET